MLRIRARRCVWLEDFLPVVGEQRLEGLGPDVGVAAALHQAVGRDGLPHPAGRAPGELFGEATLAGEGHQPRLAISDLD